MTRRRSRRFSKADRAAKGGGRATPLRGTTVANVTQQLGARQVLLNNKGAAFEWFGPGTPLVPIAPESTAGRAFDYPVNYNVSTQPRAYELVSFPMLRALADGYDLLRLAIETRKDQVEGFEWNIRAREGMTVSDDDIASATVFFEKPDREHGWSTWLRMVLEDLLVLDAVAVYPRRTRGSKLYALELIDGGTIKRVIDGAGRTPLPPDNAYQQVLHGLPAVDYTTEELMYSVRNPRTNRVYGYGPVEQIIVTVNIALRRQLSQLQYFTEGNIPEAMCGVPDTWSTDTLKEFQLYWDTMLEGNTGQRRKMKFVPVDASKIKELRPDTLKDEFDDWLARLVCYAFSLSPTALIKQTNRAVAQSSADAAKEEGLLPLQNYLRTFMNELIASPNGYGDPRLEFRWVVEDKTDPFAQAQTDQIYLQENVVSVDYIRDTRFGLPPLTEKEKADFAAANAPPPSVTAVSGETKPLNQEKEVA